MSRYLSEWQDLNLRHLLPQARSNIELVASTGGYKWSICQYNLAFSCVFNRFSKREPDSKTIQKTFCVAGCVTNQINSNCVAENLVYLKLKLISNRHSGEIRHFCSYNAVEKGQIWWYNVKKHINDMYGGTNGYIHNY